MKRVLLLLIIFFVVFFAEFYAQEEKDSLSFFSYEAPFDLSIFKGKPIIALKYGFSELQSKKLTDPLADPGSLELKLGYATNRKSKYADFLTRYTEHGIIISNFSKDLSSKTVTPASITSDIWQFGITSGNGYGYKLGESSAIIPYSSGSFIWTRFDFKTSPVLPEDIEYTELYQGSFRFGTKAEGGVKIQIIPLLTLEAGYERAAIFSRHLFWKHLGSMIIESAGQAAIDGFVREILKSSPAAGPIIDFILKNSLSYAMYELRKDKMHWPFESAAPITYDTFKIGIQFRF